MPLETTIDTERGRVTHRGWGELTVGQARAGLEAVFADPAFDHTMQILWDLTEVTSTDISNEQLALLPNVLKHLWKEDQHAKTAVAANRELVFGLAKMAQGYTNWLPRTIEVFWSLEEALAWLEAEEA